LMEKKISQLAFSSAHALLFFLLSRAKNFFPYTFRVQLETEFPRSPIMNLGRLGNVILVLSLGFEVYPSVGIYVCQIKGIDVAKMIFIVIEVENYYIVCVWLTILSFEKPSEMDCSCKGGPFCD